MTSSEIRQSFLDFFKSKEHEIVPSSPVVIPADKTLLFSEVPYMGFNSWQPEGTASSTDTDPILQYSESGLDEGSKTVYSGGGSSEEIGVNHKSGRNYFAHVAFADGHVEKLRVPMSGKKPNTSGFGELTSWLCAGYDVSFDGSRYNRVK